MAKVFAYTARSGAGAFVSGAIAAESHEAALAHLRTRALFVTMLESTDSARGAVASSFALLPVRHAARIAFFRSFATLIESGVPIRRALEITIEQCRDARLAEALRSLASDIEAGTPLSAAMARRPREFPPLFVAMIRAGEIGGALDHVLERLAELLERDHAMRSRVASALAYPAIVSCAALALIAFLVVNTMPAFASMFAQMHVALPLSTRILLALGTALRSGETWVAIIALPPALAIGLRAAGRASRTRVTIDGLKLRLPVVGTIIRKAAIARFSRTLGTLLRSGVALMTALEAALDVVDNAVYRTAIETFGQALREGDPITAPLESCKLFDPLFIQLIAVGEETGALDAMLLRLAGYYEFDVETALATLGSVLEPMLIITLGAIVGTIVASILIPLYSIIGSIT
jgi:type IV pilus assembly protein PilC